MLTTPLADIGFLASASQGFRNMITELAVKTRLNAGEVLFEQGDQGDTLFAVITGALEVSVTSKGGKKLSLDIMNAGALFGEIALFTPGPRTATLTAITQTEVWGLRNSDVLDALKKTPELYIDMIELAGMRMRWMANQYHEQVFMDVTTRLARKVLHLSGGGDKPVRMSHADLGTFVGASRETVSKTLSGWKRDGLLELGRSTVQITNEDGLRKIAENPFY